MSIDRYLSGPIIACSTSSVTNSALSVIRISGFDSLDIFQPFFSKSLAKVNPRTFYNTDIVFNSRTYDSILFVFFKGPSSFNGENILELHVHGNVLNVTTLIDLFISNLNFRIANPGEFSYRAFLNKKLSLSQVEGLDLFLNSVSSYGLSEGLSVLNGSLNDLYKDLYEKFLSLKTSLELNFDFLEDIGEDNAIRLFKSSLLDFTKLVSNLHLRSSSYDSTILSPEIVLAGSPNAGKSTFFNKLVGHRRSIVSSVPGTTRDYVVEPLFVNGIKFNLVDTAGIREETSDSVEAEGISFSVSKLKNSFFKVLVINPFESSIDTLSEYNFSFDFIVFTHADLPGFSSAFKQFGSIGPFISFSHSGSIEPLFYEAISSKYKKSLDNAPLLIARHRDCINKLYLLVRDFNSLCANETDMAIISHNLNSIGFLVAELIGVVPSSDVLNNVFTNFCIGK